jgi:PTH1 family peptidyl-tRNA hydrolase
VNLIVGLGNPGPRYVQSRHNVGFWCVNRLGRAHDIPLKTRARLATTGRGRLADHDVLFVKPRTFVNLSGRAVAALVGRYDVAPSDLLVVYDDLDLPLGRLRVRARGSHGGHKGMKSIIEAIGSQDFPRIRIGIGRPHVGGRPTYDPEEVADYVLAPLTAADRRLLEETVGRATEAVSVILTEGVEAAMDRYNR